MVYKSMRFALFHNIATARAGGSFLFLAFMYLGFTHFSWVLRRFGSFVLKRNGG